MLKRILVSFLMPFLAATSSIAAETPSTVPGVQIVDVAKAKDLIAKGIKYYDVRVPSDFAEGTIKGAVSIPYTNGSANTGADFRQRSIRMEALQGQRAGSQSGPQDRVLATRRRRWLEGRRQQA
jgi:rhodanese-related sulfurtransferase